MNDEQFEGRMQIVEVEVSQLMANQLRARDKAQCEAIERLQGELDEYISSVPGIEYERDNLRAALARVEAERDRLAKRLCICHSCGGRGDVHTGQFTDEGQWQPPEPVMVECGECGGDGQIGQVIDLDTAQAQLAEAVKLIGLLAKDGIEDERQPAVIAFLERHWNKPEQQEARPQDWMPSWWDEMSAAFKARRDAQGAQAGGERAAFEKFMHSQGCSTEKTDCSDPIYFKRDVQGCWLTWQARAALATRPAAGEPIHQWADQDLWMDGDEADMASARAEGFKTRTLWTVPPAAAHGDEAHRKDATHEAMQRACKSLPRGWVIDIGLEKDAGTVTLINRGEEVEFCQDFDTMAEQIEEAIDAAMRAQAGEGDSNA